VAVGEGVGEALAAGHAAHAHPLGVWNGYAHTVGNEVGNMVGNDVGNAVGNEVGYVAGSAARCQSSSPGLHWCGSGLLNSKYSTCPVFSLTQANTYSPAGCVAGVDVVFATARSTVKVPVPATASAAAAKTILILGVTCRIVILSGGSPVGRLSGSLLI
jgi:hypothetical protein